MTNHKEIFTALKKCNQVGKKLASNGKYILTDGMMIAYKKPEQDETEANGLSVAFIDNKVMSKMDALPFMNIEIDGNLLYKISQEGEFIQFTADRNNLYIEYNAYELEDISDKFREFAMSKGFKEEEINLALETNFENNTDIDLYELYLKYSKKNEQVVTVSKTAAFKRIKKQEESKILKKCVKTLNKLNGCRFIGYEELSSEDMEKLVNSTQPIEFKIKSDDDNETYIIRLMKSILSGANAKAACELRLFNNGKHLYLIVEIGVSGFIICNLFRVVNF